MATHEPSLPGTYVHTFIYEDPVKMVASIAYSMVPVMDKSMSDLLAKRAAFADVRKTRMPNDG